VSYLGNQSDRLWDLVPLNPAVFMGLGPRTLSNGVFYPRTLQFGLKYAYWPPNRAQLSMLEWCAPSTRSDLFIANAHRLS
jgi:hypothetical protein